MPLMIPSIAWSSAASSKITFAALPPSSSVSFFPVPASSRWIALPTSVESEVDKIAFTGSTEVGMAIELALDCLADFGRAGEGDLVDLRLDQRGARPPVAGDDVDDA